MKLQKVAGSTDQTINVFIQDSSVTTGAGLTGLVYNTSGLACYYLRPGSAAASLSLATQTVTGAHTDGGFVEIDSTNMPGWYRLDLSDALLASGVDSVGLVLRGASNMAPCNVEIQITAFDMDTATVTTDSASRTASQADVSSLATAASIAALNDLSSAEVEAACDSSLASYDGPTNAEMEARTLPSADYFDAATDEVTTDSASRIASQADVSSLATSAEIAALNDVSAAEVEAACGASLVAYDGPTNAEMEARTLPAADYFDPASDEVTTDSASRIASQANVSALATSAEISALNDISEAEVKAQCDASISEYDGPTNSEMEARTLPAASYGTSANQTTLLTNTNRVNGLIEDVAGDRFTSKALEEAPTSGETDVNVISVGGTGVTGPDDLKADVSTLATASALAVVDGNMDAVLEDTGTTIPALLAVIEALVEETAEYTRGNWTIENNQMIFYKEDTTELARFNLFKNGVPDMDAPDQRVKA